MSQLGSSQEKIDTIIREAREKKLRTSIFRKECRSGTVSTDA